MDDHRSPGVKADNVVDRFLAAVPARLTRSALTAAIESAPAHRRRYLTQTLARLVSMRAEWETWAAEVGVPCPPALLRLAEAMENIFVYIGADHGWELLTPHESAAARRWIAELATSCAELEARARMLPVFGQDGDYLLLAVDGRIHEVSHETSEEFDVVAANFDALLDQLTVQALERAHRGAR